MKPRVLIFEDNDILRETIEFSIDKRRYEVFTFPDPGMCPILDQVEQICQAGTICADIIISDINMPTKTGIELIRDLVQKGCKIKFRALMSGDWTNSDLQQAQTLGCHVFYKPFSLSEMLQWLDDCRKQIDPKRKLFTMPTK